MGEVGHTREFAEVLGSAARLPDVVAATESWGPNLAIARELFEFMMGPQPDAPVARADGLAAAASEAGLEVVDVRAAPTRVEFFDVAAIVVFLRKVVRTVPDFTVERYRERLAAAHELIAETGSLVSHSTRALIEVRRPG